MDKITLLCGSLLCFGGITLTVTCILAFASITAPAYVIAGLFGLGMTYLGFGIATGQIKS